MRNPVGGRVPVTGGLAEVGLPHTRGVGAEAVQVFVADPRGWATRSGAGSETVRGPVQSSGPSPGSSW